MITMCPHGYHHNGFMETPALGTQEVRFHNGFMETPALGTQELCFNILLSICQDIVTTS